MRQQLIRFVEVLRGRGVRVSVAETMDALNAVAAAGLARGAMREAMGATLIKDEGDRPLFDEAFAAFFRAPAGERGRSREKSVAEPAFGGVHGAGNAPDGPPETKRRREKESEQNRRDDEREHERDESAANAAQHPDARAERRRSAQAPGEAAEREAEPAGIETERHARLRILERKPFAHYSDLDYEIAREALKPLVRRFRVRAGRRLRMSRRGRIDFRRTIRASIQRGGTLTDLRFRSRRPRHVDLLILADVSGSVRYCSTLMLELVAGARQCFRRVRSFVYVDRLAEADFEQGHLVMTPALDLYARSDFGRVLGELWHRRAELLGRATVILILGDGRNNRRPPRADLLREIAHLCRAVFWLNPEEPHRWGTGDSAIRLYEREVSALVPAGNLQELERGLSRVA